ncbi:hypothetical protein V8E36_001482 [Tilletia maclaganii]
MRWTRSLLWAATLVLPFSALLAAADKPRLVPTTADLPPLKYDGQIAYRTFYSEDDTRRPYNVSTFAANPNFNRTSGIGMYGYTFIWAGKAYNPNRPLIVYYGSSASRCWDIFDVLCIINQGVYEGWPWSLRQSSKINKGLLTDAGFAAVVPISPYCMNTTTKSVRYIDCLNPDRCHLFKHYRDSIVINDILPKIKKLYGYDNNAVVGAGQSMGARGILRLGTRMTMKAISLTGGNLETYNDFFMKALPWNAGYGGESCWTLTNPNVNATRCTWPVPATLPRASYLADTKVNIYSSVGDASANLTTQVQPTCDAINKAAAAKGRTSKMCTIQLMTEPKTAPFDGPSHNMLMRYGYQYPDINFLHTALGKDPIVWTDDPPPPRGRRALESDEAGAAHGQTGLYRVRRQNDNVDLSA